MVLKFGRMGCLVRPAPKFLDSWESHHLSKAALKRSLNFSIFIDTTGTLILAHCVKQSSHNKKLCEQQIRNYYHSDNILEFIVFFLQQVINLIGPHLLPDEEAENIASKHGHVEVNSEEFPVSALDANVFRSRSRAFKKSDDAN